MPRGTPRKKKPSPEPGKGKVQKEKRLEKSEEAVRALDSEAQATVTFVSSSIVDLCLRNRLKPGWALMGACEFLALAIHQNIDPASYDDEITRFTTFIKNRLEEFTRDADTRSPAPPQP